MTDGEKEFENEEATEEVKTEVSVDTTPGEPVEGTESPAEEKAE